MSLFSGDREKRGNLFLITATLFVWLLIIIAFKFYGYNETWKLWKVPVATPVFLDFRLIPGSAESFRQGFEPTIKNPGDPAGRIFNYPAFWRLFFYTNITEDDTVWICVLMIILFFVSVLVFPERLKVIDAIVMLLVMFSPASMLLYERGNADLIVFVLCVLIVIASDYSANITAALLLIAAVIKMFPFFGVSVLVRAGMQKFLLLFSICLLALFTYIYLTIDSVQASWNLTQRGGEFSYGANVVTKRHQAEIVPVLATRFSEPVISRVLKYGLPAFALLLLSFIGVFALKWAVPLISSSERNLAAFRMGASIYVGTFLLGNNWDYRLAFLVLVIPQLMEWMRSTNGGQKLIAYIGMVALLYSCWQFRIFDFPSWNFSGSSKRFWLFFDDVLNWLLFLDLAYLLFASMPGWVRDLFRFRSPKAETVQAL